MVDHQGVVGGDVGQERVQFPEVDPVRSEERVEARGQVRVTGGLLLGLEERHGENADGERFVLGEQEIPGGRDPVLEVVGDGRMLALRDRLEAVVPPADEGWPGGGREIHVLSGQPIVPGFIGY